MLPGGKVITKTHACVLALKLFGNFFSIRCAIELCNAQPQMAEV